MATCLSIVQAACSRLGISSTTSAIGATDQQIVQLVALTNEEGQELAARYPWTALQAEGSFTTLAAEDQGTLASIASDVNYIVNDTIWNRTLRRPVYGPRTQQSWQQQQAFAINGPWSSYRLRGGHLRMYPVPVAGQSCYFEYISKNWCENAAGDTTYAEWAADTNVPLLDDQLIVLGAIWRWKKAKGFEYAEDFNVYERRVLDAMGRDGGKDFLNLTNTKYDIYPGVVVPAGSWNL